MNKHTPGPWSIGGRYAHKTVLLNAVGERIASGGNNRVVVGEELEASLRLASAAPDMLDLLAEYLDFNGDYASSMPEDAWVEKVRAIVAKATGE